MQSQSRKFFKVLMFLGVSFFSLLLLICLFEVYLRSQGFLDAQPANYPCVTSDPILNHVFIPGCTGVATAAALKTDKDVTYKVNELGFRGPKPKSDSQKVLILGDSYVEGFGLEEKETFPYQLDLVLKNILPKNVEVLNGGVMGYSTALYVPHYKRLFQAFKPEFVVLNLDLSDFFDDLNILQTADVDENHSITGYPAMEIFPSWILPFVYSNRSAVLRFVHQEANLWNRFRAMDRKTMAMNEWIQSGNQEIPAQWLTEESLRSCSKIYEMVARSVVRLGETVKADGGKFAVHMYPPGYLIKGFPQSQKSNISFVMKWDSERKNKDRSWSCNVGMEAEKVIAKLAAAKGYSFYSSVDFINNHPDKKNLYFKLDAHWNARGVHEVAAQLAPQIARDFSGAADAGKSMKFIRTKQ